MASRSYTPPNKEARRPLDPQQTESFYDAACETNNLRDELAGRILLDYGLRVDELCHMTESWVKEMPHAKTGELVWQIEVPMGERCAGGVGPTGEGNKAGKNLHDTNQPCKNCRERGYENKEWVDDSFSKQFPFHPKTANSFSTTYALPTESCREATQLLKHFLAPDRQWPVGPGAVNRALNRIREEAGIDREIKSHALRHTYGCRLAAAGKNPQAMMAQMRHANLAMTMYYSRLRGTRVLDQIQGDWEANEKF